MERHFHHCADDKAEMNLFEMNAATLGRFEIAHKELIQQINLNSNNSHDPTTLPHSDTTQLTQWKRDNSICINRRALEAFSSFSFTFVTIHAIRKNHNQFSLSEGTQPSRISVDSVKLCGVNHKTSLTEKMINNLTILMIVFFTFCFSELRVFVFPVSGLPE